MKRVLGVLATSFLVGCGGGGNNNGEPPWSVEITGDDLISTVDNELFDLAPGAIWTYEAETDEGLEVIIVEVLDETEEVWGTTATVVRDTVTLDGELVEDTFDWYGQDADGNVWYLGEDTCEYENGLCVDTRGSWEAGVDGALPGIAMLADPQVGDAYYQEYLEGEAEDEAEVVEVNVEVTVLAGSFSGCIRTRDTTRLQPDLIEFKTYCPGAGGVVLEEEEDTLVELVEISRED